MEPIDCITTPRSTTAIKLAPDARIALPRSRLKHSGTEALVNRPGSLRRFRIWEHRIPERIQSIMEPGQEKAVGQRRYKTLWFTLGTASVVIAFLIAKTVNPSPRGFGSLEDLVTELSAAIDARDEGRINELCYDSCDIPINRLAGQHEKLSYIALLREKPGWTKADSWKLGGHGSRFGHIHIDFVKQLDGKWYLKRIWGCR